MNRRQCNLLLAGGALASIMDIGHALSASAFGRDISSSDTEHFVEEYSRLVHWWQNLCKGSRPEVSTTLISEDDAFPGDLEHRAFRQCVELVYGEPGTAEGAPNGRAQQRLSSSIKNRVKSGQRMTTHRRSGRLSSPSHQNARLYPLYV